MKYLFLILLVVTFGCQKNNAKEIPDTIGEMTVVIDCTGTYLRYNKLDYMVCNKDLLHRFSNGDNISASFVKIDSCSTPSQIVCYMYHKNEGWIRIISAK